MNKRIWIAGVLGALAMYIWIFIAHMLLPLGEAGISQINNEEPLLALMNSTIRDPGMYMFPRMDPGMTEDAYQAKTAAGPSGILIYLPKRDFSFGKALAIEFVNELVQVLIGMYLLSLTRVIAFGGRVCFFALLGLCAVLATNVSYWNWYSFPSTYTLAYCFTVWVGYVGAGLVAGAMKIGGSEAR